MNKEQSITEEMISDFFNRIAENPTWWKDRWQHFKLDQQARKTDWEVVEFKYIQGPIKSQQINKIRRKADNIVIEAGKEYEIELHGGEKFTDKIKGFHYNCGFLMFVLEEKGYGKCVDAIESVREHKLPLFTTIDGVDIYENDRTWFVREDFYMGQYDFIDMGDRTNDLKHYSSYKYFSTECGAKTYVAEHKTYLSLAMIREALELANGKKRASVVMSEIQVALYY